MVSDVQFRDCQQLFRPVSSLLQELIGNFPQQQAYGCSPIWSHIACGCDMPTTKGLRHLWVVMSTASRVTFRAGQFGKGRPTCRPLKWQPAGTEKASSMFLDLKLARRTGCQASCPRSLQSLRSWSRHEMVLVLMPGLPDPENGLMHLHVPEGCPDGSQSQALHLAMLGWDGISTWHPDK